MDLFSLIQEVLSESQSLGFGEGTPSGDDISKKRVVNLEETDEEEEHDFGELRDQAKSTDHEGTSTSFQPMEEDIEELDEMSSMAAGAVEGGISRDEFVEQLKLREFVQKAIRIIKEERKQEIKQELQLRSIIKKLIKETATPDVDPAPSRATGINVLEELLKKIIPVLETDYKTLTTNKEQRNSFRAHILNAVENTIKPAMINNAAGQDSILDEPELTEEIDVDIEDGGLGLDDRDDFIPIDDEKPEETDPVQEFGIEGQNETGRNMAYQSFKKVEANILDSYDLLSDKEDQELFYDYLLTNLKLYFDKFEEELNPAAVEPTTDAYEQAVTA